MKHIVITVKRPGLPCQRIVGIFASTADAVISMISTLEQTGPGSISAKVLKP